MSRILALAKNADVYHEPAPGCEPENPIAYDLFLKDRKKYCEINVEDFQLLHQHAQLYKNRRKEIYGDCYNSLYPFGIALYNYYSKLDIKLKLIHLIREPIACVSSILRSEGPYGEHVRSNFKLRATSLSCSDIPAERASDIWININKNISYQFRFLENRIPNSTKMVKIEDLSCFDTIKGLFEWIGLIWDQKVISALGYIMASTSYDIRHSHQQRMDSLNKPKLTATDINIIKDRVKHEKAAFGYFDDDAEECTVGDFDADMSKNHKKTANITSIDKNEPAAYKKRSSDPAISVIIPTFNRRKLLLQSVKSVLNQSLDPSEYEIIIVDNHSTDGTRNAVAKIMDDLDGNRIKYVFEANPGLVNSRHAGAREAASDILVFTDDDIIASQGWLRAIQNAFADPMVSLVGGKVIPQYETSAPDWLEAFWEKNQWGVWNMYLSLIDLGKDLIEIPANFVFGLNFAIRKKVLYDCGGFHPDSFPWSMIRYRGDGEYGLAMALMKNGLKAVYHPDARVEHIVSRERLTPEYVCRRSFLEGISASYTEIRRNGAPQTDLKQKLQPGTALDPFVDAVVNNKLRIQATSAHEIKKAAEFSYEQGLFYHRREVLKDPQLLSYVLQTDYYSDNNKLITGNYRAKGSTHRAEPIEAGPLHIQERTAREVFVHRCRSFINEGRRLLGDCLYLDALKSFDNAMYLMPDTQGLQYMRALCLASVGRIAEAIQALEAEFKMQPDFAPAKALRASIDQVKSLGKILSVETKLTLQERILLLRAAQQIPVNGVVVELGSYLGASACFLSEGAREKNGRVFCVDTWHNDAMADQRRDTFKEFQANTSDYRHMIAPLRGFSAEAAREFHSPIDLLFIDADHSYEGCLKDIKAWVPKLRPGAMVIFHDYGWAEGVQRAVAEYIRPVESSPGRTVDSTYYTRLGTQPPVIHPNTRKSRMESSDRSPVELAWSLFNSGSWAEVVSILDKLTSDQKQQPHLQMLKAACQYQLGYLSQAETAIAAGLGVDTRNREMRTLLSKIHDARFKSLMESIRNGNEIDASWVEHTPIYPTNAVIYITELCNSRCITCNAWKNKHENALPTETWIDILSQIRSIGASSVEFVGGEPLLRRDLDILANEARNLGFDDICVSSNGFLLDENRLEELLESGVNSFHMSLDGVRDTYKFIRGVDWFERVTAAMKLISEKNIPLMVLTTLVRHNIMELRDIASLVSKLRGQWFANILENTKYLFADVDIGDLRIEKSAEIDKVMHEISFIKETYPRNCLLQEADLRYIQDFLEDPKREAAVPCTLGFRDIYLDPSANVYTGCMALPPVGTATKTPLTQIIGSSRTRSRLKAMLLRRCPSCTCGYPQRAELMYQCL